MRSSGTPPPSAVQLHKEGNISAGTVASRKINERAGVPYMPWFVGSSAAMFSRRLDGSGRLGTVQDVQDD